MTALTYVESPSRRGETKSRQQKDVRARIEAWSAIADLESQKKKARAERPRSCEGRRTVANIKAKYEPPEGRCVIPDPKANSSVAKIKEQFERRQEKNSTSGRRMSACRKKMARPKIRNGTAQEQEQKPDEMLRFSMDRIRNHFEPKIGNGTAQEQEQKSEEMLRFSMDRIRNHFEPKIGTVQEQEQEQKPEEILRFSMDRIRNHFEPKIETAQEQEPEEMFRFSMDRIRNHFEHASSRPAMIFYSHPRHRGNNSPGRHGQSSISTGNEKEQVHKYPWKTVRRQHTEVKRPSVSKQERARAKKTKARITLEKGPQSSEEEVRKVNAGQKESLYSNQIEALSSSLEEFLMQEAALESNQVEVVPEMDHNQEEMQNSNLKGFVIQDAALESNQVEFVPKMNNEEYPEQEDKISNQEQRPIPEKALEPNQLGTNPKMDNEECPEHHSQEDDEIFNQKEMLNFNIEGFLMQEEALETIPKMDNKECPEHHSQQEDETSVTINEREKNDVTFQKDDVELTTTFFSAPSTEKPIDNQDFGTDSSSCCATSSNTSSFASTISLTKRPSNYPTSASHLVDTALLDDIGKYFRYRRQSIDLLNQEPSLNRYCKRRSSIHEVRGSLRRDSISSVDQRPVDYESELVSTYQSLTKHFDSIADTRIFSNDNAMYSLHSLIHWMKERCGTEDQKSLVNGRLKWPESIEILEPSGNTSALKIHGVMVIRLASSNTRSSSLSSQQQLQHIKISFHTQEKLEAIYHRILSKWQKITCGRHSAHIDSIDHYVLKATGFNDYFIQPHKVLCEYATINSTLRKGELLDLTLVLLTDEKEIALRQQIVQDEQEGRTKQLILDMKYYHRTVPPPSEVLVQVQSHIQMEQISWPLRFRIDTISNLPQECAYDRVVVSFGLRNGHQYLNLDVDTPFDTSRDPSHNQMNLIWSKVVPFSSQPRWNNAWHNTPYCIDTLPMNTLVEFIIYGISGHQHDARRCPIACIQIPLVDYRMHMLTGKQKFRLWHHSTILNVSDDAPHEFSPGQTFIREYPQMEPLSTHHGWLHVEFDAYRSTVRANDWEADLVPSFTPAHATRIHPPSSSAVATLVLKAEGRATLRNLAKYDSLRPLSTKEKAFIWKYRHECQLLPDLLPKFLKSVNWASSAATRIARTMLVQWKRSSNPIDYLQLLGCDCVDPFVRAFCVQRMNELDDNELSEYLLQLVQAMKHENHHDAPLSKMLLFRALMNPIQIGHKLFWLCRNETQSSIHVERFSVFLAVYLVCCGESQRKVLYAQLQVMEKLELVARCLKHVNTKDGRQARVREELRHLRTSLPSTFQLCLSAKFHVRSILVDQCKIMSSQKKPMWLAFENADSLGKPVHAIFKCGDDLRQDLMTLQLLRLMDRLWKRNNMDLQLRPYGCQTTGNSVGMIEVVENAKTLATIQNEYGGLYFGAFKDTPIDFYLKACSGGKEHRYLEYVDNFVRSCAGYCVATYVLGIGDRHSDNIMITSSGHLFHIDFGHFLGNFKYALGLPRERDPFVFTPEMAFVMGNCQSERFMVFEDLCCRAYNVIRSHGQLFISLFELMVPAKVPELSHVSDIQYLREQLSLDLSDKDATVKFKTEIQNSLSTPSRRLDNWAHNIKHAYGIEFNS